MTIIQKCNPHRWTTPKPGDTDLTCPDCGWALSLLKICGSRQVCEAVFLPLTQWLDNSDDLNAFKGFLGKGPRVSEFHPKGIKQSLSLAREKEKTSNHNEAEAYRTLKELYHESGFYCGYKKDIPPVVAPIVWTPHGEPLPLEPSLAHWPLSPFFDWGYDGDAPSQLALALLFNLTGDKRRSWLHYQDFKDYREGPARWGNTWKLCPTVLESWLIERERK